MQFYRLKLSTGNNNATYEGTGQAWDLGMIMDLIITRQDNTD